MVVLTCDCCDLCMADVTSIRVGNLTRVFPSGVFVGVMQAFKDARVPNDFGVIPVGSVHLLALLVPCDKLLWSSSECTHQSQLLAHGDVLVLQFLNKSCRF